MRNIKAKTIEDAIETLVLKAAFELRSDIYAALLNAIECEKTKRARNTLKIIVENSRIARKQKIPICQDTGMTVVYCRIGQDVTISGGSLKTAIERGVKEATRAGFLRHSIVNSPILRTNTKTNTPPIIHYEIVPGKTCQLSVLLKGFGCENKSKVALLNPTVERGEIIDFIVSAISEAGANACPPFIVGIGLGGTLDRACEIAKKTLFRRLDRPNKKDYLQDMEHLIEKKANGLGFGPLGFKGKSSVLRVLIEEYPTHIAGLPVSVNINCHALRTASIKI